jgi:hypothetical protein
MKDALSTPVLSTGVSIVIVRNHGQSDSGVRLFWRCVAEVTDLIAQLRRSA